MKHVKLLVFITQLGLSVAAPLAGFTLLALWLRNRYGLGVWVVILGIVMGLIGAADGLRATLKAMEILAKDKQEEPPPVSFNDHE